MATTRINVAIGPSNNETRNQFRRLRFFVWARPAFISAREPQPTACGEPGLM